MANEQLPAETEWGSEHSSTPRSHAPVGMRILFWLILAALSVFFAEVVSFSAPFAFFDAWGWLVVFPLYGLHTVILLAILLKGKYRSLRTLWLAGAIFGLYEAYMTKVLWDPYWSQEWNWTLGGVYLAHTAILVLFWHAFMAFIVPVLVGERMCTSSNDILDALPAGVRTWLAGRRGRVAVLVFSIYCGVIPALNGKEPGVVLRACTGSLLFLAVLCGIWRKLGGRRYTLRQLQPGRKSMVVLCAWLGLLYAFATIAISPEKLPRTVIAHGTIWLLYAILIALLIRNMKIPVASAAGPPPTHSTGKRVSLFVAVFLVSAVVLSLPQGDVFHGLLGLTVLASWIIGCAAGAAIFIHSILAIRRLKGNA